MIQINNNTRLVFDSETPAIRLWVNTFPPFLMPRFNESAIYTSSKDWYNSVYFSLITSEDLIDQIAYFWFDVEEGEILKSQCGTL